MEGLNICCNKLFIRWDGKLPTSTLLTIFELDNFINSEHILVLWAICLKISKFIIGFFVNILLKVIFLILYFRVIEIIVEDKSLFVTYQNMCRSNIYVFYFQKEVNIMKYAFHLIVYEHIGWKSYQKYKHSWTKSIDW